MATEQLTVFTLTDLLENDAIDWDAVKYTFTVESNVFEQALFKLHFKRKKTFTPLEKKNILHFLTAGYISTNDVRYFNEFLWFYKNEDNLEELNNACYANFEKNIDGANHHYFPLATPAKARNYIQQNAAPAKVSFNNNLKVGLIGFPPFFSQMIKNLTADGFAVEQVFVPYHPKKYIRKLLSIPLLVKAITKYKKNNYPYDTLNYHHTDPAIGTALEARKFDIGFHKLNFIIKKNIFGNFKTGLINDHWGVLPFLRGKSTIAYTLLFGFPMASTLHLIEQGIDTGKIIGFYEYDIAGLKTINEVRDKLRSTLSDRVVKGIRRLSDPDFRFLDNDVSKGLTFYEIHPWLYSFIESRLK